MGGAEMNILVMGGTQFNGLALVRELARTGHDVSVCNRGKTAAELPRGVARLIADRTDPAQLRAALSGRDWDCVFDISAYRPEDVRLMSELLRGRTGHYVFASSTVIYAPSNLLPISEDFPLDRSEVRRHLLAGAAPTRAEGNQRLRLQRADRNQHVQPNQKSQQGLLSSVHRGSTGIPFGSWPSSGGELALCDLVETGISVGFCGP